MKYLKTFEEHTPIEFVAPEQQHPSYKNMVKKKKRKKEAEVLDTVMVPPNHTKDVISFKRSS